MSNYQRKNKFHKSACYKGIELAAKNVPYVSCYLNSINKVINYTSELYSRVFAVTFVLRYPSWYRQNPRYNDIGDFFRSFKAKHDAELDRRNKRGVRVHRNNGVHYLWCRECNDSINEHFHVMVFLNKDNFQRVGKIEIPCESYDRKSVYQMLVEAWAQVLNISVYDAHRAVHIPRNPYYYLEQNSRSYREQFCNLFQRASYMAKYQTKNISSDRRSFGYSLRRRERLSVFN
ncbi:YagK/YfjJ domain-containing protein [Photobacterium swingsii]|uniref:YagK/YfjJ domain-containing protein n=1 Tax=Photobacterium swingsii TaxID=680026 RepID=UPI004068A9FD